MNIFRQRFCILLFLIWLGATTGLFVLSVWGDFDTLLSNFDEIVLRGSSSPSNAIEPGSTSSEATKTHSIRETIRKEIRREANVVEKEMETVIETIEPESRPAPVTQPGPETKTYRQGAHGRGTLTGLDVTQKRDLLTARLTITGTLGEISKFWLDAPTRLVIDLHGTWKTTAPSAKDLPDSFIHRVDVGNHPDKLRLVFRLKNHASPTGDLPKISLSEQGLNITVENPTRQ